jgi:hypothetical protein
MDATNPGSTEASKRLPPSLPYCQPPCSPTTTLSHRVIRNEDAGNKISIGVFDLKVNG